PQLIRRYQANLALTRTRTIVLRLDGTICKFRVSGALLSYFCLAQGHAPDPLLQTGTRVKMIAPFDVDAGLINPSKPGESELAYKITSADIGVVTEYVTPKNLTKRQKWQPTPQAPDVFPTTNNVDYRIHVKRPSGRSEVCESEEHTNTFPVRIEHKLLTKARNGNGQMETEYFHEGNFAFLREEVTIKYQGKMILKKGTPIIVDSEPQSRSGGNRPRGKPDQAFYHYRLGAWRDPGITIGNPAGLAIRHAHLALAND
ncbi:hypothetical protein H0H92_009521, partial [Tricholoma furcatifolium]